MANAASAQKVIAGLDLDATAPARKGRGAAHPMPAGLFDALQAMVTAGKGVYKTPDALNQLHAAAVRRQATAWGTKHNAEISTFAVDGSFASGAGDKKKAGSKTVRVGITARPRPVTETK